MYSIKILYYIALGIFLYKYYYYFRENREVYNVFLFFVVLEIACWLEFFGSKYYLKIFNYVFSDFLTIFFYFIIFIAFLHKFILLILYAYRAGAGELWWESYWSTIVGFARLSLIDAINAEFNLFKSRWMDFWFLLQLRRGRFYYKLRFFLFLKSCIYIVLYCFFILFIVLVLLVPFEIKVCIILAKLKFLIIHCFFDFLILLFVYCLMDNFFFSKTQFSGFFRSFTLLDLRGDLFLDSFRAANNFMIYKEMAMKNQYTSFSPLQTSSIFFGVKRYLKKYSIGNKFWFTFSCPLIWKRYFMPIGFLSYKNYVVDEYVSTMFFRFKFNCRILLYKVLHIFEKLVGVETHHARSVRLSPYYERSLKKIKLDNYTDRAPAHIK